MSEREIKIDDPKEFDDLRAIITALKQLPDRTRRISKAMPTLQLKTGLTRSRIEDLLIKYFREQGEGNE